MRPRFAKLITMKIGNQSTINSMVTDLLSGQARFAGYKVEWLHEVATVARMQALHKSQYHLQQSSAHNSCSLWLQKCLTIIAVNTLSKMVARWVLPLSHFAKSLCNSHNLGILHSSRLLSQPPQPLIMLPVPHLSLSISATHHQYCQCVEWHISQALSEYFDLRTCDCVAGFIHTKVTCTQGILV